MLDPTIQEGGQLGSPSLRTQEIAHGHEYKTVREVPPRGAERASSDGVTIEEYQPVDQQRSMTTVAEVYTNFADKSDPISGVGCGGRGGRDR